MTPPWVQVFDIPRPRMPAFINRPPAEAETDRGVLRSRRRGDSMQDPTLDRYRSLPDTQGGAARLRRSALPWADLLHAFSVRNVQKRNFNERKRRTFLAYASPLRATCYPPF